MAVRIIGMIGVTQPASTASVHVIQGGLSAPYLREFCKAHEDAGFDFVLPTTGEPHGRGQRP